MIQLSARIYSLDDAEELLSLGFEFLELSLPCSNGLKEETAWQEIAGRPGLTLLAHGPREGNPQDLDQLENRYLPDLKLALEQASRLNVPLITVHLWLESRYLPPETVSAKIELLNRVTDWGSDLGVKVALENLSESSADLEPALSRIPKLVLTLDLGHSMLLTPESTAPEIIINHFDRIAHIHLHDNHGGYSTKDDLHLIPGQGKVPFSPLFRMLKERGYDRTATLELKPHEMAEARDFILSSWNKA